MKCVIYVGVFSVCESTERKDEKGKRRVWCDRKVKRKEVVGFSMCELGLK